MTSRNTLLASALTLSLVGALPAQAAYIINNGIYTTDTLTGLDWLDVTETQGRSQQEVINGIASGAVTPGGMSLSGWRYATGAEVSTLIAASGGVLSTFPCTADACFEERTLFNLGASLGFTRATAPDASWATVPANPTAADTYDYSVKGLIADIQLAAANQHQSDKFWTSGIDTDSPNDGISSVDTFLEHQYSFYDYQPVSYVGSFLVRDSTTISPVPLPAAIWLFAGGLTGLAAVARRKQKS